MNDAVRQPCRIERVGTARTGSARFWCLTHGANATGRLGARLPECESAYRDLDPEKVVELDVSAFPGGVAIWGAVAPIFDTSRAPDEAGVHVHARRYANGDKEIDKTFPAIAMRYRKDLFETGKVIVTVEMAVSFYLSRFLGHEVECLFCTYCREPHLDAGWFAVKAHKKHLCHACGRYFSADHKGVSNPLVKLRSDVEPMVIDHTLTPATRRIALRQADYPGGIQIWASNPAVFWIAEKPEETGIHLHAFDVQGHCVEDDTFAEVIVDGKSLDQQQVAYLMAQATMPHLEGRVVALRCTRCAAPVFDRGLEAFSPRTVRACPSCGNPTRSNRRVVSNPLVGVLGELRGSEYERDEGLRLHYGHGH